MVRGRESAEKRRKEVRRQEKQKDKAARKKLRREQGPLDPDADPDALDPDVAVMGGAPANDSEATEFDAALVKPVPAGADAPRAVEPNRSPMGNGAI